MDFEQLLDRLWGFDYEVFAHDTLMVAIHYRTGKEVIFHNSCANDYQEFLDINHLMGISAIHFMRFGNFTANHRGGTADVIFF